MSTSLLNQFRKNPTRMFLLILTAPIIYGMFFAFVIADLCATFYQAVCFPVYKIPKVKRKDYIIVDRGKLTYLRFIDKLNCVYCGYANGVIAYAGEIIARTEWYWCPIKHGRQVIHPHEHYGSFLEHGDGTDYRAKLKVIRKDCRACDSCHTTPKPPEAT